MSLWQHALALAVIVVAAVVLVAGIHNFETWIRTWWYKRHPERIPQPYIELEALHDWMDTKLNPDLLAVDRTQRIRRRGLCALEYTTNGSGVRRALVFVTRPDIEFVDQFFPRNSDIPGDELFPDYLNRLDRP